MGNASCPSCGLQFSDPALKAGATPGACPNCGEPIASVSNKTMGPIRRYWVTVWRILTQPKAFFRSMRLDGGVSGPLAFALITHWIGAAASFLWHLSIGGVVGGYFDRFMHVAGDVAEVDNPGRNAQLAEVTERLKNWFWGTGSVIADPFLTVLQILFISFLVFVGARLLVTPGKNGAPREINFESALRIVCFGMTPSILSVLPLFGGPLAYIYLSIVTLIGAREVYRIDTGRATLVAFFPQVLLLSFVLLVFFAATIAFIKFFSMTF